jgi:hypothetical protein
MSLLNKDTLPRLGYLCYLENIMIFAMGLLKILGDLFQMHVQKRQYFFVACVIDNALGHGGEFF